MEELSTKFTKGNEKKGFILSKTSLPMQFLCDMTASLASPNILYIFPQLYSVA